MSIHGNTKRYIVRAGTGLRPLPSLDLSGGYVVRTPDGDVGVPLTASIRPEQWAGVASVALFRRRKSAHRWPAFRAIDSVRVDVRLGRLAMLGRIVGNLALFAAKVSTTQNDDHSKPPMIPTVPRKVCDAVAVPTGIFKITWKTWPDSTTIGPSSV